MKEYYVYCAYGLNDELLYVGKGTKERWKHCISGASHNKWLNKYFFLNGEDGSIRVEIVERFDTLEQSLLAEEEAIKLLNPLYNTTHTNKTKETKMRLGMKVNKMSVFREYYYSYLAIESGISDEVSYKDIDRHHNIISDVETYHPEVLEIVEKLGIDVLRTCGFQRSRIEAKMEIERQKELTTPKKIQKVAKFVVGEFYNFSETKQILTATYKAIGIVEVAKANHIDRYYATKRCKRGGVMGYLIISE